LELLVQVDEDRLLEELRRCYRRYRLKFEDDPRLQGCDGIVVKHIEEVE
jgi:hypothetical protein